MTVQGRSTHDAEADERNESILIYVNGDLVPKHVNGGVKFGHCGGAKVGQFGASALERAALI